MRIDSFKDMYVAELQELFSIENQLADALDGMAVVASHSSPKSALLNHREEVQVHKQRLETILQKHGANPWAHTDQVMQMLVVETAKMVSMLNDNKLRDAGLIASARKRGKSRGSQAVAQRCLTIAGKYGTSGWFGTARREPR